MKLTCGAGVGVDIPNLKEVGAAEAVLPEVAAGSPKAGAAVDPVAAGRPNAGDAVEPVYI